jgi:hypothetical protein
VEPREIIIAAAKIRTQPPSRANHIVGALDFHGGNIAHAQRPPARHKHYAIAGVSAIERD